MKPLLIGLVTVLFLAICACSPRISDRISVKREKWGVVDSKDVNLYTMTNKNGMVVKVTNFGATITYVSTPDRNCKIDPVVLGFDSLDNYLQRHPNFGSTIGRYANRIGRAEFTIDTIKYRLTPDRWGNSIHGGTKGFSKQVFNVDTAFAEGDTARVVFEYLSHDKEEGFPGNLGLKLAIMITNDNELILNYTATTDKPTVVNFTNHTYFNLSGCMKPVLDQILWINADSVIPVDSSGIPTGIFLNVTGTPYDFTKPVELRKQIVKLDRGYDINYVLRKNGQELTLAAEIHDPESGRLLQAFTTEPGMQFFLSNSDLSRFTGHGGVKYAMYYGLCLEMQHFPDSPNKPQFPKVVLLPGETYRQLTIYKFSTIPD